MPRATACSSFSTPRIDKLAQSRQASCDSHILHSHNLQSRDSFQARGDQDNGIDGSAADSSSVGDFA
eukprot:4830767-Pleurochrysis_carterae.AAC.2